MCGREALWVPGTDHAGIATQIVVERTLAKKNISRHDLGREQFVKEVWKWKEEYGNKICNQLRRLGGYTLLLLFFISLLIFLLFYVERSLDWTREAFTMDEKLSRAVVHSFVKLHQDGLIFRAERLVNWVCKLQTVIADIEVTLTKIIIHCQIYLHLCVFNLLSTQMDTLELDGPTKVKVPDYSEPIEFGVLTLFAYAIEGGGQIIVATTRPETMLGDTAIAVHPNDPKYTVCLFL